MAESNKAIGKVAVVQGEAFVVKPDGTKVPIKVGDVLQEGAVIVTSPGGRVEIDFSEGRFYLLRQNETVTLDETVFKGDMPEERNAALLPRVREFIDVSTA